MLGLRGRDVVGSAQLAAALLLGLFGCSVDSGRRDQSPLPESASLYGPFPGSGGGDFEDSDCPNVDGVQWVVSPSEHSIECPFFTNAEPMNGWSKSCQQGPFEIR